MPLKNSQKIKEKNTCKVVFNSNWFKACIYSFIFIIITPTAESNSFVVEGSDLLMGIGPAEIGRGGASVAGTNDLFAIRWNPAGLAESGKINLTVSRQLDSKLTKVNFFGFTLQQKNLLNSGFDNTVAFAWISRLHIKTQGMFDEGSLETVFLEYALPGYPRDFIGTIESKTREYRFGWGIKPTNAQPWSFGITAGFIHCGTSSCGIRASDPSNYHVASTDASAFSLGTGIKFQATDKLTFAATIKDINTQLKVDTKITNDNGLEEKHFTTHFPTDITAGFLLKRSHRVAISMDYQTTYGKYGSSTIDFKLLRFGFRKQWPHFMVNSGAIVPIELSTETTGNLMRRAPAPLLPTFAVSWANSYLTIDFVVYPNPIMSYQREKFILSAESSISLHF